MKETLMSVIRTSAGVDPVLWSLIFLIVLALLPGTASQAQTFSLPSGDASLATSINTLDTTGFFGYGGYRRHPAMGERRPAHARLHSDHLP